MKPRRNGHGGNGTGAEPGVVRCAVYCRRSTEETTGNNVFNSTDAQREACLNYIAAQKEQGWVVHDEIFVDSGYSGGNLDRPALQRLREAIEAGSIQCVLVYRSDRLSRRILDFLQLVEMFDHNGVAFVSITEQFNTSTPGGRLYQHMLLSFAEYERGLIAERTAWKMGAARRKGKFTGGALVLGFDRAPEGGRLVVNEAEAKRVREIYRLFLEKPHLRELVAELKHRRLTLKRWTTREGKEYGGGEFDPHSLRRLLSNPEYVAEVHFKGGVFPAEHPAIVDRETWDRVQASLAERLTGPRRTSTPSPHLLAGILRCAACEAAMTPTFARKAGRAWRYYVCGKAHRDGWATCPTKSVSATKIEGFILDHIRAIGRDPEILAHTTDEARRQLEERKSNLRGEIAGLRRNLQAAHGGLRGQIGPAGRNHRGRGACEIDVPDTELKLAALEQELLGLASLGLSPDGLRAALAAFDSVWQQLTMREQQRVVHLLIERIDYSLGKVSVAFSAEGMRALAAEGKREARA